MKAFLTFALFCLFFTCTSFAGTERVEWQIHLPWGAGQGKQITLSGIADTYSGKTRTLHKLGKSTVAVYAYTKEGRVWVSIGPKYVKSRKFYPIVYGTEHRYSNWYKLDGLRGSKYYAAVARGKEIDDRIHSRDGNITINVNVSK